MGKTLLLAHLVWNTRERLPLLPVDADPWLASQLGRIATEMGCSLLAVGNASDHVHVMVRTPPTLAISELANRLKGASSRRWKTDLPHLNPLYWRESYWAESCSPSVVDAVCAYVRGQRAHHAHGGVQPALEPPPDEDGVGDHRRRG